jgi:hypothetical protein
MLVLLKYLLVYNKKIVALNIEADIQIKILNRASIKIKQRIGGIIAALY